MLDQRYGDLGSQAAQFYNFTVKEGRDSRHEVCCGGPIYTETEAFNDRRACDSAFLRWSLHGAKRIRPPR